MVPKIHQKGTSFISVHRYNAHDKNADTSHRLEWTETLNLGTNDPGTASRVMAATAMDSSRLKEEAGIRNTGRKSNQHVFHATLSWHEEEGKTLSKAEMVAASKWFLRKLGADDRQAVLYSHKDATHPHVHIVMNRVSPKDGRMLSSSMEKLRASKWAEKYEKDRGKIYCDQRVLNNKARKRGQYVRCKKDDARHFHEMRKQAGNNNTLKSKVGEEIAKMRQAYHAKKQAERDHTKQQEELQKKYQDRIKGIREGAKKQTTTARQNVQRSYADEWSNEYFSAKEELGRFLLKENHLLGRVSNALDAVNWRHILSMQKGHPDGRAGKLGEAFNVFGNSGARAMVLVKQQALRENEIKRRQNIDEAKAIAETRQKIATQLRTTARDFIVEQNRGQQKHDKGQALFTEEIKTANRERRKAWQKLMEEKRAAAKDAKRHVASNDNARSKKSTSQEAPRSQQEGKGDTRTAQPMEGRKGPPVDSGGKAVKTIPEKDNPRPLREDRMTELLRKKREQEQDKGQGRD